MDSMWELRQAALERQKLLFVNRCTGCPYRDPNHYSEQCLNCPVLEEFLEIGVVLTKTLKSYKKMEE